MRNFSDEDDKEGKNEETNMEVDGEGDLAEVMQDPEFIASVLETLPGVDPNDPNVRQLLANISKDKLDDKNNTEEKDDEKK